MHTFICICICVRGCMRPYGIGLSCAQTFNGGCQAAKAQLQWSVCQLIGNTLLAGIGSGMVTVTDGGGGADIGPSCAFGVPCIEVNVLDNRLSQGTGNNPCTADSMGAWEAPVLNVLANQQYNSGYFMFHHSAADTMVRYMCVCMFV